MSIHCNLDAFEASPAMKVLFLNPQQEMGGIQCLSAFLKRAGHDTALVNDANLFDNPWVQYPTLASIFANVETVLDEIGEHDPDLIALPVVTDDFPWAVKWAKQIKSRMDTPIVFGNVHPTFNAAEVLSEESVDYIVRGEGEWPLLELVEVLEGKRQAKDVLGLGYKRDGVPQINSLRPLIDDLDTLPYPDKDLYYDVMPYLNQGYTTMSGRGCPYKCTFCDNNTSMQLYKTESTKRQKWTRRHSPQYVVDEILWAKQRYGIKHVRFNDEDFSYDKKWIREFAPLYKEKVGIPYFAWVYPNTIDDEIAQLLADSGCDAVEMGIQSGSSTLRNEVLHRRTKDEQILTAMSALRKNGIRATVDIIIGLPTETKDDLDETVRLLAKARPWHLYAFWLRYYPSTEILTIAKERKLLTPEEIAKLESGEQTRGHIAGGTELEKDKLSRSYHAFIVLLPLMPTAMINFCVDHNLIRFFPTWISPFLMVNVTKMIKRDPYNEFRVRGRSMLWTEAKQIIKKFVGRLISGSSGKNETDAISAGALRDPR
jgi:anaerobic magnesium-protoporphyrin IX monomethyl ester cyclase